MGDVNKIGGLHYEMMRRCYNENYVSYKDYGAKGVKVCEEWHDRETFKAWAYANGYVKGMRVLRYDTSGDYCPENCYIGESPTQTIKGGYNQMVRKRAKANKSRKASIGVKRIQDHPLYETYHGMMTRCMNPNSDNYKYYGERGIKICDEWLGDDGFYNFAKWAQNCGEWEQGLTIERIDVNGDYCPKNCTFITMYEQAQNRRNTHIFVVNGKKMSATAYCRYKGINCDKFLYRLNKGMSINKILDELEK